jgi:uncharacterized protein (DUF1501 family)
VRDPNEPTEPMWSESPPRPRWEGPTAPIPHETPPDLPHTLPAEGVPAPSGPPPPGRGLDRRRFLALAGGVGALGALGAVLGPRAWDGLFGGGSSATTGAMGSGDGATLVLLTLYGGNDGLNTVIPYHDPAYAATRGSLAVAPSTVLPLADGFGLHAGMPGFKKLWDARELAIVHGVGFADPNYSHFESMDIWQSGVPETPVSTGWLGRWLDGTKSSPLRAIALGPTLPTALSGEKVQGAAIPIGPLELPGDAREQTLYAAVARAAASDPPLAAQAASSDRVLLALDQTLGPILDRSATSNPLHLTGTTAQGAGAGAAGALAIANGGGGTSTGDVLAVQLSTVANLILAGAGADVYSVELGGFDTHANQVPVQSALLTQVDTAVTAFVDALRGTKRGARTVVLVYTEFGRRVGANASAGTDHGWANVAFVAGPSVKGGFYGEPPSLTKLSQGNTVYTTDFRTLYATMLSGVLGADPKPFLEGSFPQLAVV